MRIWSGFEMPKCILILLAMGLFLFLVPESVWAAENHTAFLASISISILAATVFAYFATLIKHQKRGSHDLQSSGNLFGE